MERLERARVHRERLHVGGRVRAHDRDNVGTVVAIADQTGTAWIRFTNTTGATTHRWMHWADTAPIDNPEPAELTPAAARYLTTAQHEHAAAIEHWQLQLAENGVGPDEHDTLTLAIQQRATRVTHQLTASPPAWLRTWLGARPSDPTGATVWDDETRHLATWRDIHHLQPDTPGYGPPPHDPDHHHEWLRHQARSLHNRTWLRHHTPHLDEQPVTPLDPAETARRLAELQHILATAPPDQTRIIRALHDGTLQAADLHQALTDAHTTQHERRTWILEHWPHVIEHAELTRAATHPRPTPAPIVTTGDRPSPPPVPRRPVTSLELG